MIIRLLLKTWHCTLVVLLMTMSLQTRAAYLTTLDEVTTGYYKVYSLSYNATMAMSEASTGSNNVFCDTPDANDYMQVWYILVKSSSETTKTVEFQNVVSERWINRSSGNFHTWPTAQTYTMALTETGFIIYNGNGFHHQQSGHDVVSYGTSSAASKWQLEKVSIDETALATQKADYTGYVSLVNNKANITTALATYFTDASCSELKTVYQSYSDNDLASAMTNSGIPQTAIAMAQKVKNSDWATYQDGWRYNEKTFRIGTYKPVSKESLWRSIVQVGYALSPNSDPTGIYVEAGNVITVYVGAIPSSGTVLLRNVPHQSAVGDAYTLTQGFNILKIQSAGCLFVDYEVDNTTNGAAPFTALSSYPDVTIHIEGGKVNGVFSATRGDNNSDWAIMKEKLFKHYDYLQLRSRKKIFNMRADYVIAACPTNMTGLLGLWDKVVEMEHNIMGLDDEFPGYFNTPMMAVSFTGSGHMYASSFGTYYNENTLSDVMRYENLFAGGSLWGPAHEIGHINQKVINIVGQSEVSNNVFSNIAVYQNGHLTSRAELISNTFQNMANNVYWQDRGLWERTHLYFQLYQFCHVQGYRPNFYQDFFKALRADPCTRTQNIFINATDDYLKFYKKACEVSGYDLTELFQAYGFFIVPQQTEYTLSGVTKKAFQVGDYGTFYLVVTQEMINEAIADVKAMGLPKANAVFIEDRITAPDATYDGATAGTKKTAFSGYPFGKGDVGQYTDFVKTFSAQGYSASYVVDQDGNLDVQVNHTGASGAVGFKVYDKNNHLVYLSNYYTFSVPEAIFSEIKDDGFRIVAAGPDGNDQVMDADYNFVEWVVKDKDDNVLKKHFQVTQIGDLITSFPEEIQAPFVELTSMRALGFEYYAHMPDAEKKIEVEATINTPFKSSTNEMCYFYNVKIRNGYLYQDNTSPSLNPTLKDDDCYRWAFYGNPYEGYRIKNKQTGQWLCAGESISNSAKPVMKTTDPTYWDIGTGDKTDNFLLSVAGTNSRLNDSGAAGKTLIFYADNSSKITVSDEQERPMPKATINAVSHLSSFSNPLPVIVPDDVNIFIVTETDVYDGTITVQWIDTKVVPANTGVLLSSNYGGEKTLSMGAWVDNDIMNLYAGNLLKNTSTDTHVVTDAENIYALRDGQTAFARVKAGVRIRMGRAYLDLSSSTSANQLIINFSNEPTGIIGISQTSGDTNSAIGETPVYNIYGQRVSRSYKGIIIRNGIKTIQR